MSEITKYYKGKNGELLKFSVERDDIFPTNCRTDWDNGDVLCLWWNRYSLGDNEGKGSPGDTLADLVREIVPESDLIKKALNGDFSTKYEFHKDDDDGTGYEARRSKDFSYWVEDYAIVEDIIEELQTNEMMELLQSYPDKIQILPCFIYEHGGLTISCSNGYPYNDKFDSGCAGFIYTTRETVKVTGTPWEQVRDMMIEDVKTYDMYLQGEVYGYKYETEDGDEESCWGFYSDKWGDDLFNELASEAGFSDVEFIDEDDVEIILTETRRLKAV